MDNNTLSELDAFIAEILMEVFAFYGINNSVKMDKWELLSLGELEE